MSYGHNNSTKKKKGWNVKESAIKGDTFARERVDLDPREFDRMIEQKGVNIRVFRSMYCPNVKSVDGAEHNIDCELCNGSSFVDVDCIETKGFIQSQDLEKLVGLDGFVDGNSVAITFKIGIEIQYFTRIELIDFTDIYYQRIMRKPLTLIDVLKYKACRVNVVIDQDNIRYFQDQDFKIDASGNVQWLVSGSKPADNKIYSIHYETHVQYRAVRAMHSNRFTQFKKAGEAEVEHIKMPEQWLCTKEFLIRRKDINGNDQQQGPFDNHTLITDND